MRHWETHHNGICWKSKHRLLGNDMHAGARGQRFKNSPFCLLHSLFGDHCLLLCDLPKGIFRTRLCIYLFLEVLWDLTNLTRISSTHFYLRTPVVSKLFLWELIILKSYNFTCLISIILIRKPVLESWNILHYSFVSCSTLLSKLYIHTRILNII